MSKMGKSFPTGRGNFIFYIIIAYLVLVFGSWLLSPSKTKHSDNIYGHKHGASVTPKRK